MEQPLQDQQSESSEIGSSQNLQNFTYYYSSFDLFDDTNFYTFIKYRKFIKKLHYYLGGEWQIHANLCAYKMIEDTKRYLLSEEIFEIALQSWLEIRNIFTRQRKTSFEEKNCEDEIEYFEENQIYEQFLGKFINYLSGQIIDMNTLKPVAQGFFMSAVEIWNETIKSIKNQRILSEQSLVELEKQREQELYEQSFKKKGNENEIDQEEEQIQQEPKQEQQSILGKWYGKVKQSYGSTNLIVKPLIVASETIMGYLGQKKRKEESDPRPKASSHQQMSQGIKKNFEGFRNLFSEEEVVMSKIKQLSIQERSLNRKRKQRELLEDDDSEEEQTRVQVENFPKKAEKLNEQVYNYATYYLQNLKKNTQETWQVARGFVTNIIELNNNILNKTQKISSEYTNSIKIRFLQPAQQFYNHLMEIWIIFRQNSQGTHDFKRYLEKVKLSMGNRWSENYVLPTQIFFKTLVYTWDQLLKEDKSNEDEETLIKIFVDRVRENMLKNWETDIVNKIKLFKNKNDQQVQQKQQQQSNNNYQKVQIQKQSYSDNIESSTIEQESDSNQFSQNIKLEESDSQIQIKQEKDEDGQQQMQSNGIQQQQLKQAKWREIHKQSVNNLKNDQNSQQRQQIHNNGQQLNNIETENQNHQLNPNEPQVKLE